MNFRDVSFAGYLISIFVFGTGCMGGVENSALTSDTQRVVNKAWDDIIPHAKFIDQDALAGLTRDFYVTAWAGYSGKWSNEITYQADMRDARKEVANRLTSLSRGSRSDRVRGRRILVVSGGTNVGLPKIVYEEAVRLNLVTAAVMPELDALRYALSTVGLDWNDLKNRNSDELWASFAELDSSKHQEIKNAFAQLNYVSFAGQTFGKESEQFTGVAAKEAWFAQLSIKPDQDGDVDIEGRRMGASYVIVPTGVPHELNVIGGGAQSFREASDYLFINGDPPPVLRLYTGYAFNRSVYEANNKFYLQELATNSAADALAVLISLFRPAGCAPSQDVPSGVNRTEIVVRQ